MFAIFTTGNKQYKVQPNDVIYVDKLPNKENEEIKFDHVLMVDDKIGTPYVANANVVCEVIKHGKQKKLHLYKFKSQKHHLRRQGHRQQYTKLLVKAINL
ncbi:50S ribosomal protein L21 [bacterium]|nr:50S ribosomal protein L21 [bacterium]MBP5783678.1 50S ribosomal protein L21 [bacterium]